MPIVSVIVPVYNAESTLQRALDSLCSQSLRDIEIICINDGSTDHSGRILEDYSSRDPRVKAVTQENQGVSNARNHGMRLASGEYLSFLDSDDYIEPETYELMYAEALRSGAEMVVCDYWRVFTDRKEYADSSDQAGDIGTILSGLFSWNTCSANYRLYKRASVDVLFRPELSTIEDKVFVAQLLSSWLSSRPEARIVHLPKALYNYDINVNAASLTKKSKKQVLTKTLYGFEIIFDSVDKSQFARDYYSWMFQLASNAYWNTGLYGLDEDGYISLFSKYLPGILEHNPPSIKRSIISTALTRGFRAAGYKKLLLLPEIAFDRIKGLFH